MSLKQIPGTLRAARRTLDILPSVKILNDWTWREDVKRWILHCQIRIEQKAEELIPESTNWYVLVASEYPWGDIEFYPAKQNGLDRTFPHQNFNSEGKSQFPWRNGKICLSTSLHTLERHDYDAEPYDIHWRLHWHFQRAIQWLIAASQKKLVSSGEHFELPHFPASVSATVVFTEGIESFSQWQKLPDSIGLLDLVPLSQDSNTLFVKSFRSVRGHELLVPTWGKAMTELNTEKVSGIWVRLNDVPVLKPWQAPSTWKELRDICREQEIEIDERLKEVVKAIRDSKPHILLIGFPIPSEVGVSPCQMHWQTLQLPILSHGLKTAKGFRTNELGYWQHDRTKLLYGAIGLDWGRSENWHPDQILARGRFPEIIATKNILLLGVGAVGSVVAELLSRGNVQRITLVDSDEFEVGNLSRHTLSRESLKENKATSVAKHLNLASPHAIVEAIECEFPFVGEEQKSHLQQCDLILDCTGSDSVLYHLEHFAWENEKIFVSISLGMRGKRLFCFAARGRSFPSDTFKNKLRSWLEMEREEYRDELLPWSGIGCWHPVFPARVDDVWMLASVAVKHLDSLIKEASSIKNDFAVFEQIYDENNTFCGIRQVGYYESHE